MGTNTALTALVQGLEGALIKRDVRSGYRLLEVALPNNSSFSYITSDSVSLLLCIAQWVDLGFRDISFFESAYQRIPASRSELPARQFLRLKMVDAYRELSSERFEACITILDVVLRSADGILDDYLVFLARFWKGRAHRKRGEYEEASTDITLAREAAGRCHAPKLIAVAQIHESWLAFQKGNRDYAFQLLDEAERALRPTGHALSLGNIESARGRFVRRSGEYVKALRHFESAVEIYTKSYPSHPNLARALVNAAYVKRLIAIEFRSRGKAQATGATHSKALRIVQEALDLLARAGEIYSLHHHQGGTGSVLVNSAHLHLDGGDIDRAEIEGSRAYALGLENNDQILMARSQIVLSAVEEARVEEELGEEPEIALHASMAVQHAESAIELALHTQNKRLLAEAFIARGLAAASNYYEDWDIARSYEARAAELLSQDDRDHLYKLLRQLRSKLIAGTKVEEKLRLWSEGYLGTKTFQQVQEEFAELVIPKVWMRCGKNVAFVSKTLSISPKKVRRILRNTSNRNAQ